MIAFRGLSLALWHRNRIWLLCVGGYLTLFGTLLCNGVSRIPESVLALGTLFAVFAYLALIGVFIHQDADVSSPRSSYPPTMFTLPVKTAYLVLCPMVLGTIGVFGCGLVITLAARLGGATLPLLWPAGFAATLLSVLQVIFWFPIGIPYSKVVLTFLAIPSLIIGLAYAVGDNVPEGTILAGMIAIVAGSYATAYYGLSRARRGDWREVGRRPLEEEVIRPVRKVKPFVSAGQAQRWYEWRLHGVVLPMISGLLGILFYIPLFWNDTLTPLRMLGPDSKGQAPAIPTYLEVYLPVYLVLIPCIAWIVGCGMRRSDVKRGDRTFLLFFGTRPLSDAALVGAKLRAAATSSLISWGIVLLACLPLALVRGGRYDWSRGMIFDQNLALGRILLPYLDGRTLFFAGGILTILMAVTWRNYVIGFWTELSGKLWLCYAYPLSCAATYCFVIALGSYERPNDTGTTRIFTFTNFVILVSVLVVAKLAVATYLGLKQYREGLLDLAMLKKSTVYYAVAFCAFGAMSWFLTDTLRDSLVQGGATNPFGASFTVVALLILWTPLTRILATPLMLSSNRHRE